MEEKKFLGENALAHLKLLLDNLFQKREHKTGSESDYKVLSDNNLTDELVNKINKAGSSSFSGKYNDLTGIPTLDGTELKGTLTKEDLDIASKSDIPTNNKTLINGAGYQTASDVEKAISNKGYQTATQVNSAITSKGYQTADDVEAIIEGKEYQTADDVETAITGKGYQTSAQVETAITGKGYQTASDVNATITGKGYQTKSEVEAIVNGKVASTYKYKGSVATYDDLTTKQSTAQTGDVYNVEDTGGNYAWTGKEWDSLGSTIDTSIFIKNTELTELSNEEIDAIFNS